MAKKWFNANEMKGLPGLPTSERGVLRRAQCKDWKSRPRRGLGGGSEFHISHLPPETRLYIEQREPSSTIEKTEKLNSAQSIDDQYREEEVKWFTTGDLLKQPGMPKTKQGIAQRAEREGWERRQGAGKRIEFAVSLSKTSENRAKRSKYHKRSSKTKLSDRLREVRQHLNKNIPQMAKIADVSSGAWSSYESGITTPGSNVLEILAETGFDPTWLLTGNGQPVAKQKERSINFPVEVITTYDELQNLLIKALDDKVENPTDNILLEAWIAVFSAVEDYCLYTGDQIDEVKKEIIYVQLMREYLWGRNPYDKRIIPQIIKNLFILAEQRAVKVSKPLLVSGGEGKKYKSNFSIHKLPSEILLEAQRMILDHKYSQIDITEYCQQQGYTISKSAMNRYCMAYLKHLGRTDRENPRIAMTLHTS